MPRTYTRPKATRADASRACRVGVAARKAGYAYIAMLDASIARLDEQKAAVDAAYEAERRRCVQARDAEHARLTIMTRATG